MKAGKEYVIQFASLSLGKHEYQFKINAKFFENLDYSEIKQGDITVDVSLLKQSSMMILQSEVKGTVKATCDTCVEEFDLPIQGSFKLIVKVGGNDIGDGDDDIITIPVGEHQLDLRQYFYEYITLLVPIKRVHPVDESGNPTCNKTALDKLKKYMVNPEAENSGDSRWDMLKNIKLN